MTPPDSDACQHGYAHGGGLCPKCHPPQVVLPLDLSRRILAALEGRGAMDGRYACADELRERMPK